MIFLLDDDPLVLIRLRQILENKGYQTVAYDNPVEFLKSVGDHMPSCAFVDLQMPEMTGLEVQKISKERNWNIPMIFISAHGTIPAAVEAMRMGGVDFIEKPLSEPRVTAAAGRGLALARKRHLLKTQADDARSRIEALGVRETEVLELMVRGMMNKQIAGELEISERMVKVYRARIFEKMGVDSVQLLVPIFIAAQLSSRLDT